MVDNQVHFLYVLAVLTAFSAAYSKFPAVSILRVEVVLAKSSRSLFPLSALVPVSLQTRGIFKSTN